MPLMRALNWKVVIRSHADRKRSELAIDIVLSRNGANIGNPLQRHTQFNSLSQMQPVVFAWNAKWPITQGSNKPPKMDLPIPPSRGVRKNTWRPRTAGVIVQLSHIISQEIYLFRRLLSKPPQLGTTCGKGIRVLRDMRTG